jgi:hypothetical protein
MTRYNHGYRWSWHRYRRVQGSCCPADKMQRKHVDEGMVGEKTTWWEGERTSSTHSESGAKPSSECSGTPSPRLASIHPPTWLLLLRRRPLQAYNFGAQAAMGGWVGRPPSHQECVETTARCSSSKKAMHLESRRSAASQTRSCCSLLLRRTIRCHRRRGSPGTDLCEALHQVDARLGLVAVQKMREILLLVLCPRDSTIGLEWGEARVGILLVQGREVEVW